MELEVGVGDRQLGEDRLVVAQRLAGRAVLVSEPADEVRDFEADRRRPVGLVLHGLPHDPGGPGKRQARAPAIRAGIALSCLRSPRSQPDGQDSPITRQKRATRSRRARTLTCWRAREVRPHRHVGPGPLVAVLTTIDHSSGAGRSDRACRASRLVSAIFTSQEATELRSSDSQNVA